jgi:hypothetical protein
LPSAAKLIGHNLLDYQDVAAVRVVGLLGDVAVPVDRLADVREGEPGTFEENALLGDCGLLDGLGDGNLGRSLLDLQVPALNTSNRTQRPRKSMTNVRPNGPANGQPIASKDGYGAKGGARGGRRDFIFS